MHRSWRVAKHYPIQLKPWPIWVAACSGFCILALTNPDVFPGPTQPGVQLYCPVKYTVTVLASLLRQWGSEHIASTSHCLSYNSDTGCTNTSLIKKKLFKKVCSTAQLERTSGPLSIVNQFLPSGLQCYVVKANSKMISIISVEF